MWLDTQCKSTPAEAKKYSELIQNDDFELNKTYIYAVKISTARHESPRTMCESTQTWDDSERPQLVCQCLLKSLGLPHKYEGTRTDICLKQEAIGLQGTHKTQIWKDIVIEDEKRETKIPISKTKYYCLCSKN